MNRVRPFRMPGVLVTGEGAFDTSGEEVKRLGCHRVLIVTDPVMASLGHVSRLQGHLSASGISSAVFDGVVSEPTDEHVDAALRLYRAEGCDAVVALGGGSPIDAGKAVALMALNDGTITDYMGLNKIPHPSAPFMAIPTTAGTGSEVTIYVVITDTARDVKMLIGSPCPTLTWRPRWRRSSAARSVPPGNVVWR